MCLALEVPLPHQLIRQQIRLVALLLVGIAVWVVNILLLIAVTHQLLDTLAYIIELAQMG